MGSTGGGHLETCLREVHGFGAGIFGRLGRQTRILECSLILGIRESVRESGNYHPIAADCFLAGISGNKLTVTFEGNGPAMERPPGLTVMAGDIFHTIRFG